MENKTQGSLDRRLARVEGQVRGLRRMVAEDAYCIDILTQVSAVRSAVDQFAAELAMSHVQTCIIGHGTESEHNHCKSMTEEELFGELKTTLSRLIK
jgi:CsoR family transcriptional regulator, copper-sensing transcriptional repressor